MVRKVTVEFSVEWADSQAEAEARVSDLLLAHNTRTIAGHIVAAPSCQDDGGENQIINGERVAREAPFPASELF